MASQLSIFMHAERIQESGNNYSAHNSFSDASGAYQFLFTTWQGALRQAGLSGTVYYHRSANQAPPTIQDAAAAALMGGYYAQFHSWADVAEAWYGGPGAVGHPSRGGGVGYPNVGQYAAAVIRIFNSLGGSGAAITTVSATPPAASGNVWARAQTIWHWAQSLYGPRLTYLDNFIVSHGKV